jgi:hypothetical protein
LLAVAWKKVCDGILVSGVNALIKTFFGEKMNDLEQNVAIYVQK